MFLLMVSLPKSVPTTRECHMICSFVSSSQAILALADPPHWPVRARPHDRGQHSSSENALLQGAAHNSGQCCGPLSEVVSELATSGGMAELAQCLGLDLTDSLARHPKLLPDLL